MIKNNQTYYYHADGLGSIIAITDSNGNVVQRYEYNSFGEITYKLDPNFNQPYTYTGREYDSESGLYYYRARYYDAKVGRFISEDPFHGFLKYPQTQNRYSYVQNSPFNYIDPWGLKCECKNPFWNRAWENFVMTNEVVPGLLAPTGLGLLTSSKVAETTGGITLLRFIMGGFRGATLGGVTFTGLETGIIAGGTALTNFALIGLAWEGGVATGSIIGAAILPCE